MKINGCTAVITGGASGLGEACARAFVAKGAKVAIFDLNREKGKNVSADIGADAFFSKVDVTNENSVTDAVNQAADALGGIKVVINCAGIGFPEKVLGKEGPMPMSHFDKTIRINLYGTMNVIRLAAEKMVANKPNIDGEKGVVINTSSISAFEGLVGHAAYAASKAAIVGMTLPIAREFADYGIRVMTIAPGLFDTPMLAGLPDKEKQALTDMIPFPKRFGNPSEFAMLAMQIVENPVLNGETIRLDSAVRMGGK